MTANPSTPRPLIARETPRILVIDMAGNGFMFLKNGHDETWTCHPRNGGMNAAERDRFLANSLRTWPNAEVREVVDFNCRIPLDWCTPETRVL